MIFLQQVEVAGFRATSKQKGYMQLTRVAVFVVASRSLVAGVKSYELNVNV